jgi:hypothetical protein
VTGWHDGLGRDYPSVCSFHAKIFPRSQHVGKNPLDEKSPRKAISSLEKGEISAAGRFKSSGQIN